MSNSYFKERKLTHEYVEMQLYLSITTVGKHRNEKTNSFPGNLLSLHTQIATERNVLGRSLQRKKWECT